MMNNTQLYPWQIKDWQGLQLLLLRKPKVLLITYTQGCGEETIASIVAKQTLCLHSEQMQICKCKSCEHFKSKLFEHPDLSYIKLDEKNKGGIDGIRETLENANLAPHLSASRITLIHQAHYLTPAAQNGLLKSLEDPQGGSYLLLTSQVEGMLSTLCSRAMKYHLRTA